MMLGGKFLKASRQLDLGTLAKRALGARFERWV
jgi:hypothetical protein